MEDEKRSIRLKIYPSNILCQNFVKIGKANLEKFAWKALEGGAGRDRDPDSKNVSGRDGTGTQIFGTGRDRDPDFKNLSGRDGTGTEISENQRDGTGPGPKFEKRPGRDGTGPRPVPSLPTTFLVCSFVKMKF